MSELAHNQELVNTFLDWIQIEPLDGISFIDLRSSGAIGLGNLSRSGILHN